MKAIQMTEVKNLHVIDAPMPVCGEDEVFL